MSDLKQFLELFNPLPGNHFIQVTTKVDETTRALYELLETKESTLKIALYSDDEPNLQDEFPHAKIQFVKNFSHPFRALPRDNDIVILKDLFHLHKNQDKLLKTSYTTLANTAEIIIMQEKGTMDIEAVYDTLVNYEFRTPNYVDILPEYDLIIAKKMHMWGNGL